MQNKENELLEDMMDISDACMVAVKLFWCKYKGEKNYQENIDAIRDMAVDFATEINSFMNSK